MCSILRQHLISTACILLWSSAVRIHWFTGIQENGCDKGAHQSYHGIRQNAPVVPNMFQSCQCCCHLCNPGQNLRIRTLVSHKRAQVLEVCDCLVTVFVQGYITHHLFCWCSFSSQSSCIFHLFLLRNWPSLMSSVWKRSKYRGNPQK